MLNPFIQNNYYNESLNGFFTYKDLIKTFRIKSD